MNQLWRWALTVALGGFLFGFDTAVISGATSLIQAEWGLSDLALGQMVAAALYGTVIGALFGGVPADKFGRRTTLIGIAVLFFVSALWSMLAPGVVHLSIARFIGGLGVGASSVVAPLYITEVAPAARRGKLVASFQFNLVVGILLAYLSNYVLDALGYGTQWRMMLGVEVLPAALFLILLFRVPRSPRWLITKAGRPDEAYRILTQIDPTSADAEFARIRGSNEAVADVPIRSFLGARYRRVLAYAFIFATFNQLSGINAVMYYAPDIFANAGLGRSSALLSSVGVGAINVAFTFLGMNLIDRLGRRKLMYAGSIGYIVSLAAVAFAFLSGNVGGVVVPICLFVFVAAHAIGQGSVIWVFLSEIFGNEVRGLGTSWGCGTHWVFAALISATFPFLASTFGEGPIFAFFSVCMVGQLLWVHFVMPETSGVDLEELQQRLEVDVPTATLARS